MRTIIMIFIVAVLSTVDGFVEDAPILERIEWSDIWIAGADEDTLPRVLLVGDSIVKGYYNGVDKKLEGKAIVRGTPRQNSSGIPTISPNSASSSTGIRSMSFISITACRPGCTCTGLKVVPKH